jgi:hypothetical protein
MTQDLTAKGLELLRYSRSNDQDGSGFVQSR